MFVNKTNRFLVSCTIWRKRETKKAEMSVLDISSAIIDNVEAMPDTCDYVYIGLSFSILLSLVPAFCRLCEVSGKETNTKNIFNKKTFSGRAQFYRFVWNEYSRYACDSVRKGFVLLHYRHEICIWWSNMGEISSNNWFCSAILFNFFVLFPVSCSWKNF